MDGLGIDPSKFNVTDKSEYKIGLKTPESTRDASKLPKVYETIAFYKDLITTYPIVTIKDPFDQDDWSK